jgi:hypothetical protein
MPTNSNETSMILKISMISMEKTIHILFSYSSVLHSIHGFTDLENAFDITNRTKFGKYYLR